MEEIVTIDGHQFKLTVDRPLTAIEKEQVVAQIRVQTGCGTCGPRTVNMGNDWQYGGRIETMGSALSCTTATKNIGSTITLTARPTGGTANYTVYFWKKIDGVTPFTLAGSQAGIGEAITSTPVTYTVLEADLTASTGDAAAVWATGAQTTNGYPTFTAGTTHTLAAGSIRFYATTVDSCPTGSQVCVQECDVAITCVAPTCNFVVA